MTSNMVSLQVPVSRKTPLDGKLEIPAAAAEQLKVLGADFQIFAQGAEGRARLDAFECTCGKAAGERHVHHFVVSPLLQRLTAGAEVRVEMDLTRGVVRVE